MNEKKVHLNVTFWGMTIDTLFSQNMHFLCCYMGFLIDSLRASICIATTKKISECLCDAYIHIHILIWLCYYNWCICHEC